MTCGPDGAEQGGPPDMIELAAVIAVMPGAARRDLHDPRAGFIV
jgi:hypothetical protein